MHSRQKSVLRPVVFNDEGWRRFLPAGLYSRVHRLTFKGANRLRQSLRLQPFDIEVWISRSLAGFASPGSLVLDIGAQHGRHVRAVIEQGVEHVQILAFEANPELAGQMEERFSKQIASNQVRVINAAVGDVEEVVDFHVNTFDSGYSGLRKREIQEIQPRYVTCRVKMLTIDHVLRDVPQPVSCIKIDVEGAELAVLNGAACTISHYRPVVLFECANNAATFYGSDLSTIVKWFMTRDFRVSTLTGIQIDVDSASKIFETRSCTDFLAYPLEAECKAMETLRKAVQKTHLPKMGECR